MKDFKLMTDKVICRMLTENTGVHFLDSGGEHGRGWQQRAGMDVAAFRARPPASVEVWRGCEVGEAGEVTNRGDGYVELDTFHYLSSRLDYCHPLTTGLHSFGRSTERADEPRLATVHAYVAKRITGDPEADEKDIKAALGNGYESDWGYGDFNSYNDENLLSSTIQGVYWTDPRYGRVVAIQTHNGCDVRGGYSTPHVFTVACDEVYDLFEWHAYSAVCSALGTESQVQERRTEMLPELRDAAGPVWSEVHCWDFRSGDWIEFGGACTGDPWGKGEKPQWHKSDGSDEKGDYLMCPACQAPMGVYPYPC